MQRLSSDEKQALADLKSALSTQFSESDVLKSDHSRVAPSEWFIGPKGSSVKVLESALKLALDNHIQARHEYFPDDPELRRDGPLNVDQLSVEHIDNFLTNTLNQKTEFLTQYLKGSIPLASYRNQSHMYWDISIPSIVGYFAGMLYNQNNVAAEASPVTTMIEKIVGQSLCKLVGYTISKPEKESDAWGHITCDGSVANIEAMWAARNLKYLPFAFAEAIRSEPSFESARHFTLPTIRGDIKRLTSLTSWELLNLDVDVALAIQTRLVEETDVTTAGVLQALDKYSIQSLGVLEFSRQFLDDRHHAQPLILVPQTAHYSWQKAATLLGLGFQAILPVPVDLDGRLNTKSFRHLAAQALDDQRPIIQVVGVLGSTEESSVDPIEELVTIRQQMNAQGLNFYLHADGAWGGYFKTLMQPSDEQAGGEQGADAIKCFASDYVQRQLHAIKHVDSITLDPHKSGFVPYAAGSLCYRNGSIRHLISIKSPVVDHGGVDENVGLYGVEGSKPGATACSVFLSHDLIGLHHEGYGELLNQCIYANKQFHIQLVNLFDEQEKLTLTTFQRLPAEKKPGATAAEIQAEKKWAKDHLAQLSYSDLMEMLEKVDKTANEQALIDMFSAVGGDLSIVNYSFNFKVDGVLNRNLTLFNELNDYLFQQLSLHLVEVNNGKVPSAPLILTAAEFSTKGYSHELMVSYAERCGVYLTPNATLKFLISTTQNPWLTETEKGTFIPKLMDELKTAAEEGRQHIIDRYGRDKLLQLMQSEG